MVAPYVGVWIETGKQAFRYSFDWSHPMWVCGLKLLFVANLMIHGWSHPMWVCGLKLSCFSVSYNRYIVAPYVGVWIETIIMSFIS